MGPQELEGLFRHGTANGIPIGYGRGRPLFVVDAGNPQRRAKLTGVVWKGKHFFPDGHMVNQWAVGRAVKAPVRIDPSWLDGQPCVHVDYPPGAPIFGNTRDELRELAPGLFLGRYYERCPCPRLKGYFALEMTCSPLVAASESSDAPRRLP